MSFTLLFSSYLFHFSPTWPPRPPSPTLLPACHIFSWCLLSLAVAWVATLQKYWFPPTGTHTQTHACKHKRALSLAHSLTRTLTLTHKDSFLPLPSLPLFPLLPNVLFERLDSTHGHPTSQAAQPILFMRCPLLIFFLSLFKTFFCSSILSWLSFFALPLLLQTNALWLCSLWVHLLLKGGQRVGGGGQQCF